MARRAKRYSYNRQDAQSILGTQVSIDLKHFNRAIRDIGDKEMRPALVAAGRKAIEVAEEAVKNKTPVGNRPKRGRRLKDTVKGQVSSSSVKLKVGSKRNFHTWWVHAGHKTRGGSKVLGRPFIREGVSESYGEFLGIYISEINQVIDNFNNKYKDNL